MYLFFFFLCLVCPAAYGRRSRLAFVQVKQKLLDESSIVSLAPAPAASLSTCTWLLQPIQSQLGSSLAHMLTHHNYDGNHGHHYQKVVLAFGCIQWHSKGDSCVGRCIEHLLLHDNVYIQSWRRMMVLMLLHVGKWCTLSMLYAHDNVSIYIFIYNLKQMNHSINIILYFTEYCCYS